jgi:hypothetical protein
LAGGMAGVRETLISATSNRHGRGHSLTMATFPEAPL